MKDELVAVVQEPPAVDRLVMADRQVAFEPRPRAGERLLDRDRLDPVNRILELKVRACRLSDVKRRPWVGRLGADVQEQRAVGGKDPAGAADPFARPIEVVAPRQRVVVAAISDAEVVGRGGDDRVHRAGAQTLEDVNRVAQEEAKSRAAGSER
jgi:hypothetical protein